MPKILVDNSQQVINAVDESTLVIKCDFTDDENDAAGLVTLIWSLTDSGGNIINSREDVNVSDPSSTEYIVLSGDDLKYSDGITRILTLEATYNSDRGNNLPLKESLEFRIDDLLII